MNEWLSFIKILFFKDIDVSNVFKEKKQILDRADNAIKKSKRQMYYSNLSLFEEQMKKFGQLDFIPIESLEDDSFIQISKGWKSKCIKTSFFEDEDDEENTWIVFCEKNTFLPKHKHMQEEFLYVVSGCIERLEDNTILKEGQELVVHSLEEHGFFSKKDSILIVTFRPPLKIR